MDGQVNLIFVVRVGIFMMNSMCGLLTRPYEIKYGIDQTLTIN